MGVDVDNNNQRSGSGSRGRRKASVAETLAMWGSSSSSSSVNRRAPAKGSRKGCMRGKGGPDNSKFNYRGVRQKLNGKWVSEIRVPGEKKKLWLGTFQTAIQAALWLRSSTQSTSWGFCRSTEFSVGRGFWNRSNQYQLSVGRWRGHCHFHLICLLARSMMICCSMCRGFRNRSNQYQLSVGMRRGHWNSPAWIPSDQGGLTKHGRLS